MSSDEGEVYIMREDGDEEWVSPTPARTAIADAVIAATELEEDDLEDIASDVDLTDLAAALEAGESHTLTVEGHEVTVDPDGDISVAE
jgi:hypothetical protein